jgi:hypothetical protein
VNHEEIRAMFAKRAERYSEIKHLADRVKRTATSYARNTYRVRLDDETRALTNDDLLLLCDGGNACFGGNVRRLGDSASVDIYTD